MSVAQVDEVEQRVGGGGLVGAVAQLAQADVVDDEQLRPCPAPEPLAVGAVGEPGEEIVDEVDAARVAHGEALLAGEEHHGLEKMTLTGPALARDDEIGHAADELEPGELQYEGPVERGLEVPVEVVEELALAQPAGLDATLDAAGQAGVGLAAQDVLEKLGVSGLLGERPGEVCVEGVEGVFQSEDVEGSSEPFDEVVSGGAWGGGAWGRTSSHGA